MDTKSKLNPLLSFLVIAVFLLSFSMEGVSTSNSTYSSSQQSTLCKDAQITSSVDSKPFEVQQADESTDPAQGATAVSSSCSISLQVIPVEKQQLVPPRKTSFAFSPYTPAVSSQAFVFQEPDPPQTV